MYDPQLPYFGLGAQNLGLMQAAPEDQDMLGLQQFGHVLPNAMDMGQQSMFVQNQQAQHQVQAHGMPMSAGTPQDWGNSSQGLMLPSWYAEQLQMAGTAVQQQAPEQDGHFFMTQEEFNVYCGQILQSGAAGGLSSLGEEMEWTGAAPSSL
ncbi:hypothetical protein BDZ91DRAFT_744663 [Kalaharituber pfeilii]|nr:hypothetical protein BDZ91DRAFT_744663 [Kalaharituber pfeilii]